MNDLAELALGGLDSARRYVRGRPMRFFGVAGLLVACVIVVPDAALQAVGATRPLTTWFDLQNQHRAVHGPLAGIIALIGMLVLIALWIIVTTFVRATRQPIRRVCGVAAVWAAPFAVGPPLLSTSVYSNVAFGLVQQQGGNPYHGGAAQLGNVPLVEAIDPAARGLPSSAGPIGALLQHLSVSISAGNGLGGVIVLRIIAVVAAVAICRVVLELAPRRRPVALALVALNPLVLLYGVSVANLTLVLVALTLTVLLLARQQRWTLAVFVVCIAGVVSPQAFFALPAVLAAHMRAQRGDRWRAIGQDVVIVAVVVAGLGFAVPHGSGWVRAISSQFSAHAPFSIAGATSAILRPLVPGAPYDDVAIGGQVATVFAMVCTVCYLLITSGRRALSLTVAYTLLAVGLLAPTLYPWYLLGGILCLAPRANRQRYVAVIALSAAGCVLTLPGFAELTSNITTGVLLAVVAVITTLALRATASADQRTILLLRRRSSAAGDLANGRSDVGEVDRSHHGGDQRDGVSRRAGELT